MTERSARVRGSMVLWAAAALGMVLSVGGEGTARAQNPENVFKKRILFSKSYFPSRAKSKRAYISMLRKRSQTKFWEQGKKPTKGKPNYKERYWKIYLAAFFPPHRELEMGLEIWDITDSRQGKMVASDEWMLDRRGQRAMLSDITLQREKYGVNRKLRFRVRTVRGNQTMASGIIWIRGEKEVFSGKVDFSDD